jgi:hypothetical protein
MFPTGGGLVRKEPEKRKPPFLFGDPSTFAAAANQQGSDYDSIMKQYQSFINNVNNNGNRNSGIGGSGSGTLTSGSVSAGSPLRTSSVSFNPLDSGRDITSSPVQSGNPLRYEDVRSNPIERPRNIEFNPLDPRTTDYNQSDDVTDSLGKLKELAETGGYSPQAIQDIRERNLSPIRSIYASGKQNLERQRSLSGGYSPNFNAVTASMARDQASQIGNITTRTNADIAQNVASNRLAAASPYAGYSARANDAKTSADQRNTDIINQINESNAGRKTSIDEFNTSMGVGVDKYNRDTQLGVDVGNRDFRANTDRYNRDTQLGVDKYNSDKQLGVDERNRDVRLNIEKYNRDTQLGVDRDNRDSKLGVDKYNRDTQLGADRDNRDTQLGVDKFNIEDIFRKNMAGKQMNQDDINKILEAIKGQASLYGTTPGLTSMFGNQVVQAGQLGQGQQDINNRRRAAVLSAGR